MKEREHSTELQFFICCNDKPKGECCSPKGALELRSQLKDWAKQNNLHPKIRITASKCLGFCSEGIAAVMHPQNKTYVNIDGKHLDEIKKLLLEESRKLEKQDD